VNEIGKELIARIGLFNRREGMGTQKRRYVLVV
jgi:hypothetical protein